MKLRSLKVFGLAIPFVEAFAHSTKERKVSDAIVVRVETTDGEVGYGEGSHVPMSPAKTALSYLKPLRAIIGTKFGTPSFRPSTPWKRCKSSMISRRTDTARRGQSTECGTLRN